MEFVEIPLVDMVSQDCKPRKAGTENQWCCCCRAPGEKKLPGCFSVLKGVSRPGRRWTSSTPSVWSCWASSDFPVLSGWWREMASTIASDALTTQRYLGVPLTKALAMQTRLLRHNIATFMKIHRPTHTSSSRIYRD